MPNSFWAEDRKLPKFSEMSEDVTIDVAIVGGGITGITTAYLLKQAGLTVALLEKGTIAQAETGHTTAHLTYVTDERLPDLVSSLGRDHARAFWEAGEAALLQIDDLVEAEAIACDFGWAPAYLHEPWQLANTSHKTSLSEDAALAEEFGFHATFVDVVPLANSAGVRFANQAKFHPLKYLAGLVARIAGDGSYVFERAEVTEIKDEPLRLKCGERQVHCGKVVVATHVPLMGIAGLMQASFLQTKLALYSSYAIGARLPLDSLPEAMFWDISDPYYYLRVDRRDDHDYVIFGGEDHKTGQVRETADQYRKLEQLLRSILPRAEVTHRWSGQVIETSDAMPYIGEFAKGQYIATGFGGNGMTLGTLSAMMIRDSVLGRTNPWSELFDPHRTGLRGGTWDYLKENSDYPYYLIRDRIRGADASSIEDVRPGEGKIVRIEGHPVAVSRDDQGELSAVSASCTHLGCLVHWNGAEKTWDCPCHGSRFRCDGGIIAGPAETPLAKQEIHATSADKH
ncbi:MAG: FAD-dependent oxidoreductase [Planctomycetia bacterium]|nr:FAD-dependent oxidoreductase [Planctomycetia bacterium]